MHGFVVLLVFVVFLWWVPRETSDPYLYKICAPKPTSLICGVSRESVGLDPAVLKKCCPGNGSFVNFAFAGSASRYHSDYIAAIKKRLGNQREPGLCILGVSPTAFFPADDRIANPLLKEMWGFGPLHRFEYLGVRYKNPKIILLLRRLIGSSELKKNGLYVMRKGARPEKINLSSKLRTYEKKFAEATISPEYVQGFESLVKWLLEKEKTVVAVRLPSAPPFITLENRWFPTFTQTVKKVCDRQRIRYIDGTDCPLPLNTVDGTHLDAESAQAFSNDLRDQICPD